ncbi:ribosome recycling factor [Candidatus Wolfebacteria bacterium]|nr:MAG: ribosome recycling factor [Candidatus Wolfebacteria bacterium]
MAYDFINFKKDLVKVEEWLSKELSQIHTGLASPVLLDPVLVESYGSHVPLNNIASITIEDPKTLRVIPYDNSQVKEIEKAIGLLNIGVSLSVDGTGIRIIFPQLTTERRTSFVKIVKDKLEDARISLRGEREKVWEDIQTKQKNGEISEDDKYRSKDELQKLVDASNLNLESLYKKKEIDLLEK